MNLLKTKNTNQTLSRPKLNRTIPVDVFLSFYWLKQELIEFCRKNQLLMTGSKNELTERISHFLKTGKQNNHVSKQSSNGLDSDNDLTFDTPVINYKNDAKTGQFFKKHIGQHFHFNAYLRQFAKERPLEKLTYGDLIKGWIVAESLKKDPNYKTTIDKQFQYNQFIRDFFTHEKGKTQLEAINAWHLVKAKPGPCTYEYYKWLINNEKQLNEVNIL